MPGISASALQWFVASSAVTLFSKLEPALAREVVVLNNNEEQDQHQHQQLNEELKQRHNGHRRMRQRQRQQKESGNSVVVDDENKEQQQPFAGSLKNMMRAPARFQQQQQRGKKKKECNPDVGILACEEGDICQRRHENDESGVCVRQRSVEQQQQQRRSLETIECGPDETTLTVYIAADANSNDYNTWALYDYNYTYFQDWTAFAGGKDAPVNQTVCLPVSDLPVYLTVYDGNDDGIMPYAGGQGIYLSSPQTGKFFEAPNGFYCPVPYQTVCYSYYACIKCSIKDCCVSVDCDDTDVVIGNAGAGCTVSPTSAPSESAAPSAGPTVSSAPSISSAPSGSPSLSSAPSLSAAPSSVPSGAPSLSQAPSTSPAPSGAPTGVIGGGGGKTKKKKGTKAKKVKKKKTKNKTKNKESGKNKKTKTKKNESNVANVFDNK